MAWIKGVDTAQMCLNIPPNEPSAGQQSLINDSYFILGSLGNDSEAAEWEFAIQLVTHFNFTSSQLPLGSIVTLMSHDIH